ncbi:YapH protein [Kaumoebavirus]|uniref:YapH protein n=1 Tax=Kaumoebavirus TaxID=1859492 RepID=UPI0009C2FB39|nr:YapH protein [Kaumoebavirus]ARA72241.1 YapH protein [Kaumoebavirus]
MANIENSIANIFLSIENNNTFGSSSSSSSGGTTLPLSYTTTTVGDNVLVLKSGGDLDSRLVFTSRPEIQWGGGSGNPDTFFYRETSGTLTLSTTSAGTANGILKVGTIDATQYRLGGITVLSFPATNNGFIGTFVTHTVSGARNLGIAPQAMTAIASGNDNVGVGFAAGKAITTGSNNALYGSNAANVLVGGSGNTIIGTSSAPALVTGSNNTALGYGVVMSNGISNSIAIGANASVTASNTTVIGNASTTACTIFGTISFTQGTIGNNVLTLQSTAGVGDNPSEQVYQNKAQTTDATITTIHTFAVPASSVITLDITVVARRTGGTAGTTGDSAAFKLFASYKNISGTVSIVGGTDAIPEKRGAGDQAWDVDLTISGTNVLLRATGAVNNNISWVMTGRYYALSS